MKRDPIEKPSRKPGERTGRHAENGTGTAQPGKKHTGRPSLYSPELARVICSRLADGTPLDTICGDAGMPAPSTVRLWVIEDRDGFASLYARARELQAHAMADQVLSIADDARNDWMERRGENNEGWELNGEHIQRSRLRVDSRKWLMGKMLPKTYGDKTMLTGPDGETAPKFVMMGVVEEASAETWEAKQRAQIDSARQESLGVHGPKPKETQG